MGVKSKQPSWVNYKTTDRDGTVTLWEHKPELLPTYGMWYRRFTRSIPLGNNPNPKDWGTLEVVK